MVLLDNCRPLSGSGSEMGVPVPKVAELKKLRTSTSDRQVLGAEITSIGVSWKSFHKVQKIV